MRHLVCALVATCALPASAHATFGAPMSLPASGQEFPVALHEVPDMHNYTGWRDALHPHLTQLLAEVWG